MITVKMILAEVAAYHGITVSDLRSGDRSRCFSWPRQEAFYIAHKVFDISLNTIGRAISKDHTTVMSGIRNLEARMLEDLRGDIDNIVEAVRAEELVQMGGVFRSRNLPILTGAVFHRHPSNTHHA